MPVTSKDNSGVDLSKLGFTEVQTHDDLSKFGFSEVKKKVGGSSLSVGQNGQLQTSVPTTSNSEAQSPLPKSPEPNFGMASFADLAKGQQNVSDNTGTTTTPTVNTDNLGFQKAHEKELQAQNKKVRNDAIDNTVQRSLKLKGINAQPNSLLYNIEKSTYNQQLDDGNAVVGVDKKTGKPGLNKTIDNWDSFHNHMMSAINENKDSREFHSMADSDKIKYLNKLQQEQNNTEYIGEKAKTPLGSVLGTAGSALPTLGLYGAGAMAGGVLESLAPETGGLSNLALKPVMSFVTNAGTEANKAELQGTSQRYFSIKQQHPDISDEEALTEAKKGSDVDRLAGIAQAGAFSETGGLLGKSVTKSFIKDALKTGVDIGGKTALVEGAKDVGHNIEGVTNKSASDIAKDMGNTFAENAPMGVALHGFMAAITGISKVPNLIKSGLKYDVVSKMSEPEIQGALDKNVQSGAITPEQVDKAATDLNNFAQTVKKLPNELSDESKASVAGLIQKRSNIEQEATTKDVTAQPIYKQQIDAINNQISDIQRTGKPLEHEIDETTGQTYQEPTYDNVAKQNVIETADKISKGKELDKPELIQAESNFPDELKKQLVKIQKQETPKEDETQSDAFKNVSKYLKANESENKPTEITQPAPENKGIVNESKFPKPEKPIHEMNSDELDKYAKTVKDYNKSLEVQFFGEEGAKKYREAQSISNNYLIHSSDPRYKEANALIDKMENSLTEQQKNEFFAMNAPDGLVYDDAELRDIGRKVRIVEEAENADELSTSVKNALSHFNKENPSNESLAILNAAKKKAVELNIDPKDLIKKVIEKVGGQYKDTEDAAFMMKNAYDKLTKPNETNGNQQPKQITNIKEQTQNKGIVDSGEENKVYKDVFKDEDLSKLRNNLNAINIESVLRKLEKVGKIKIEC